MPSEAPSLAAGVIVQPFTLAGAWLRVSFPQSRPQGTPLPLPLQPAWLGAMRITVPRTPGSAQLLGSIGCHRDLRQTREALTVGVEIPDLPLEEGESLHSSGRGQGGCGEEGALQLGLRDEGPT